VFKTLLTHPDARPILRDLISGILQIPVLNVEVKNIELPITDISQKRERLDVNCEVDGQEQVDVEMQTEPMSGDKADNGHIRIRGRAIFNLCDLHAAQSGRGISYEKLKRSFQITFCDYTVFPERRDYVNRFSFRNAEGEELLNAVGIIFIELSKIGEVLKKPFDEMTAIEMWCVFFAVADKPAYRELITKMTAKKKEIKMASELLASISHDPVEVAHFLSRRKFQMDLDSELAWAFSEGQEKGKTEGKIEGKIEGKTEGKIEGKIETAKKMLRRNRPIDEIVEYTDLAPEKIELLRHQMNG
jgi:predicted transposase/invertase (TIGR01784 family)